MTEFAIIPVLDAQIFSIRRDGQVYVPMKQLCAALGLPWEAQRQRIQNDAIMGAGIVVIQVPSAGGTQDALCLPLRLARMFLFTVPTKNIRDDSVRAKVLAWQEENLDAIDAYWTAGVAINPRFGRTAITDMGATQDRLVRQLDKLKHEKNAEHRRLLHGMVVQNCDQLGLDPPALDAIGTARPEPSDLAAPLFAGLAALDDAGVAWDHSRNPDRLAFNLKDVAEALRKLERPIRVSADLRAALKQSEAPRFVLNGTVNSALTGSGVHCYVFARPDLLDAASA